MSTSVHIVVEGLVQGVGFRWFVHQRAEAMALHGWVRNLPNGSVEVEAEGDRSLLEALIKEIKVGPRSAHVSNLRIEWRDASRQYHRFEIR